MSVETESLCSSKRRRIRLQTGLLIAFCLFAGATCWGALYPKDLWLQHAPTVPAVALLAWSIRRTQLSTLSFAMLIGFCTLHAIGGRYIYSFVPYDRWAQEWLGFTVSQVTGWQRNHYDRLVHFAFGFLLAYPAREILERLQLARGIASRYFAVEFIIAAGALYELGEWLVAMTFAPDWADRYLGQQGDIWDAQKDMALETAGAIIAILLTHAMKPVRASSLRRLA